MSEAHRRAPAAAGTSRGRVPAFAQSAPPPSPKADEVTALVDRSRRRHRRQGQAVFPEFREAGGPWRTGPIYLVVADLTGKTLLNAAFPQFEGTDVKLAEGQGRQALRRRLHRHGEGRRRRLGRLQLAEAGRDPAGAQMDLCQGRHRRRRPGLVGAGIYPKRAGPLSPPLFELPAEIQSGGRQGAPQTGSGESMKRPRRGLTLEQAVAELERLGAEVRSMTTQLVSLRARVTDLEQWEKDIAAASVRKHVGKRVRKHAGLKVRKH